MFEDKNVTKSGLLFVLMAMFIGSIGTRKADAASYTYTLNSATSVATGTITTTCDNCVLNASNITAWSMSQPGVFSISSTSPGAHISMASGDNDMVATPSAINFNFDGLFGGMIFNTSAYFLGYFDFLGHGIGANDPGGGVSACSTTVSGMDGCAFITTETVPENIASVAVPFAGSVNYTFTATVTSATGIYATAGTAVTGTLTFDLNAGDGALPVSVTAPWSSISTGTPQVVASTLKSGSVTFSDAGSTSNKSTVAGLATAGSGAPNEFFASDIEFSSPTNSVEHSIQIIGGTGANAPFATNGLPIFQKAAGSGTLLAMSGGAAVGQLNYTITSLTVAPNTLSISPASVTFPNTPNQTQSEPLAVTIKNTSRNDVSISAVGFNPDEGNFKVLADGCEAVLGPNASCTVSIVFSPFQAGVHQTSFSVTDSAQGSPQVVTVAGTATVAPEPAVSFTGHLQFDSQQVGTTSAEKAVTLKNTGNAPLSIYSIALVGPLADDFFTLRNACGSTLAVGQACTFFVSFTPFSPGTVSASVVVSNNSPNELQQSLPVIGAGTTVPVPGLTLSTAGLSFANQTTGTASVKHAINLTNTGTAPLTLSSIKLGGAQAANFVLQNACVATLAVGQRCAVFVAFKPVASGDVFASVVISSNASGSGAFATLTGTATAATAPALTLSTSVLTFAGQKAGTASTARAINLTNSGTAPLSLTSIAVVGVGAADFSADFPVRDACVPTLAPGQHCAIFVTFKPVAAGGMSAILVINDNAQVSQQTVDLVGQGLE